MRPTPQPYHGSSGTLERELSLPKPQFLSYKMRVTQGCQEAVWVSCESIQGVILLEAKHKPQQLGFK